MLLRNNEAYFWRTALQIDGNKDSDLPLPGRSLS